MPFINMMTADNAPVIGKHYITTISDTFTLVRGNHTFGARRELPRHAVARSSLPGHRARPATSACRATRSARQPVIPCRPSSARPSMPGIQTQDIATAASLYALLTGRLSQVQTGRLSIPRRGQYSDSVFRENWTSSLVRRRVRAGPVARDDGPHAELRRALGSIAGPLQSHQHRGIPRLRQPARPFDAAVCTG